MDTATFRRKGTFEAFQLTEDIALRHFVDKEELPFRIRLSGAFHPGNRKVWSASVTIGKATARLSDWIFRDGRGVVDSCTDEDFIARFEAVAQPE